MTNDHVAAWGWTADALEPLAGGLINQTFQVRIAGAPVAVVQKVNPIFGAEVNEDLEAVTDHLAARGVETPRLIRTRDGRRSIEVDGEVWRALTWIDGESVHAVPDVAWAEAGGELVGRFHRAVEDFEYDYRFVRAGVHDTAAHFARLRDRVERGGEPEAIALGREILATVATLPELPTLRRRHVHGDLKISNLIFRRDPIRGACLIDLDTFGRGTMAFELGDAMRSWCNPNREDAGYVRFALPIFAAAIAGFRSVADPIVTRDERLAIVAGLEIVCVELAARFAVDVFDDRYFGWDPTRFPSRRAHNLVRARGQLALGLAVRAVRAELLEIVLA